MLRSRVQDPEGILAAPQGGHIQRRNLQKQLQTDKELAEQVEKERLKARDELMRAREVGPGHESSRCSNIYPGKGMYQTYRHGNALDSGVCLSQISL